jgi:hypothetical protein
MGVNAPKPVITTRLRMVVPRLPGYTFPLFQTRFIQHRDTEKDALDARATAPCRQFFFMLVLLLLAGGSSSCRRNFFSQAVFYSEVIARETE